MVPAVILPISLPNFYGGVIKSTGGLRGKQLGVTERFVLVLACLQAVLLFRRKQKVYYAGSCFHGCSII